MSPEAERVVQRIGGFISILREPTSSLDVRNAVAADLGAALDALVAPPSPSAPAAGSQTVAEKTRIADAERLTYIRALEANGLAEIAGAMGRDGQTIADLTRERLAAAPPPPAPERRVTAKMMEAGYAALNAVRYGPTPATNEEIVEAVIKAGKDKP